MKTLDKKNTVIKNTHTKAEMQAIEQEFIDHRGPFLTLEQALKLAETDQIEKLLSHEKSA